MWRLAVEECRCDDIRICLCGKVYIHNKEFVKSCRSLKNDNKLLSKFYTGAIKNGDERCCHNMNCYCDFPQFRYVTESKRNRYINNLFCIITLTIKKVNHIKKYLT